MKRQKEEIKLFETPSMKLFLMLGLYFLSILVLYSITQLLNINNILGLIEIVSLLIPLIYILLTEKKSKILYSIIGIFLAITLLLPYVSTKTYDITVDGNSYHKTAIAFIKNGWNPFYQSARSFQKTNSNVIKLTDDSRTDLWIEHYPKATWIIAAVIYNFTGDIESGKCITVILSIMLLIITYNVLRKIIDKKKAALISLIVILNPIVLAQIFSYYVDGIMGICFLIELLLLFHVNPMEKQDWKIWISLASIAAIFSNLKFTGLMCSGVIAAVFYFYWLFKYHKEKEFFEKFKNITYLFIGVYVTAVFLVGANSYIKNTIDHHNPLYPLIGKDKVDIITTMQPKDFNEMNTIEKFTMSLFSKTENTTYDMIRPELKWPFRLYRSEIGELYAPDTRIGGFGPLFTLSLLLSILVFIPSIILLYKNEKDKLKYFIISILSIVVSMIMLGESWWARYVPQFYLVVIGTIILGMYTEKYSKYKKIHIGLYILPLLILIANFSMFLFINFKEYQAFRQIDRDLVELKNTKDLNITINPEGYGYQYNLKDKGITYNFLEEIDEDKKEFKYSWRIGVEKK